MAEKTPAQNTNSRLERFEKQKAEFEAAQQQGNQETFEESLYGKSGTVDEEGVGHFSEEDRARIEEGETYEQHLARMADEGYESTAWEPSKLLNDTGAEGRQAFTAEHADETINERTGAESAYTRQMNDLADRINALRRREQEGEQSPELTEEIEWLEERFNKLPDLYRKAEERKRSKRTTSEAEAVGVEPQEEGEKETEEQKEEESEAGAQTTSLNANAPVVGPARERESWEKSAKDLDSIKGKLGESIETPTPESEKQKEELSDIEKNAEALKEALESGNISPEDRGAVSGKLGEVMGSLDEAVEGSKRMPQSFDEAGYIADKEVAHEMALEEDADRRDRAADIRDLEAERPEVERSLREIADRERMAMREEELAQGIAEREAEAAGRGGFARRALRSLREGMRNGWSRAGAAFTIMRNSALNRIFTRENEEGEREISPLKVAIGTVAAAGAVYALMQWGLDSGPDEQRGGGESGIDQGGGEGAGGEADTGEKGGEEGGQEKPEKDQEGGKEAEEGQEKGEESREYPADAYEITEGQGWLEAMEKMGITDEEVKRSILDDEAVMGQLKDMGLAYRAPELGGWGLYLHGGEMPEAALDVLKNAAASR